MPETLVGASGSSFTQPAVAGTGKRILLVTVPFPPHGEVGAIRAERLARTFTEAGHEVTALTVHLPSDAGRARRSSAAAKEVVTVEVGERHAARLLRLMRRFHLSSPRNSESRAGSESTTIASEASRGGIREFVLAVLALPDSEQHFIRPAAAAARQWKPGDFDIVYSTAPPFSGHIAAQRIASRLGARLILEFRDPWNHSHAQRVARSFGITRKIDDMLERRCLEAADSIVAVSEGAAELIRSSSPGSEPHVILNGIPSQLLDSPQPERTGPLSILYAGSLYLSRDPRSFLESLALVLRKRKWTPQEVRLDFLGECRFFHEDSIEEYVQRLGISDHVTFTDRVPHVEATRRISEADILLLLAQEQPIQIPNKLYDYLGMRVPVIAYADAEGETTRMLEQAGGHLVMKHSDPAVNAEQLERLLASRIADRQAEVGDMAVLNGWRSELQMQLLLEALDL